MRLSHTLLPLKQPRAGPHPLAWTTCVNYSSTIKSVRPETFEAMVWSIPPVRQAYTGFMLERLQLRALPFTTGVHAGMRYHFAALRTPHLSRHASLLDYACMQLSGSSQRQS